MSFQARPTYDVVPKWLPASAKYDLQFDATGENVGNPTVDDQMGHAVLSLLYSRRGEWFADRTGRRGSELHTLRHDVLSTPGKVVAFVEDALRPLLDAKRITRPASGVLARATRIRPGVYDIVITYSRPNGRTVTLRPTMSF